MFIVGALPLFGADVLPRCSGCHRRVRHHERRHFREGKDVGQRTTTTSKVTCRLTLKITFYIPNDVKMLIQGMWLAWFLTIIWHMVHMLLGSYYWDFFSTEHIDVISNIRYVERDYIFRNWRVKAELESKMFHFIGNIR